MSEEEAQASKIRPTEGFDNPSNSNSALQRAQQLEQVKRVEGWIPLSLALLSALTYLLVFAALPTALP